MLPEARIAQLRNLPQNRDMKRNEWIPSGRMVYQVFDRGGVSVLAHSNRAVAEAKMEELGRGATMAICEDYITRHLGEVMRVTISEVRA